MKLKLIAPFLLIFTLIYGVSKLAAQDINLTYEVEFKEIQDFEITPSNIHVFYKERIDVYDRRSLSLKDRIEYTSMIIDNRSTAQPVFHNNSNSVFIPNKLGIHVYSLEEEKVIKLLPFDRVGAMIPLADTSFIFSQPKGNNDNRLLDILYIDTSIWYGYTSEHIEGIPEPKKWKYPIVELKKVGNLLIYHYDLHWGGGIFDLDQKKNIYQVEKKIRTKIDILQDTMLLQIEQQFFGNLDSFMTNFLYTPLGSISQDEIASFDLGGDFKFLGNYYEGDKTIAIGYTHPLRFRQSRSREKKIINSCKLYWIDLNKMEIVKEVDFNQKVLTDNPIASGKLDVRNSKIYLATDHYLYEMEMQIKQDRTDKILKFNVCK